MDASFIFGSRLFPGNFNQLSSALNCANHLYDALFLISKFPLTTFPLLRATLITNENETGIEWRDVFGLEHSKPYLVETAMAALVSFSKWQSATSLPWRFEFDYAPPEYLEQYEVHFSDKDLRFNLGGCRMWLKNEYLYHPWRFASTTAYRFALNEISKNRHYSTQQGFCGLVSELIADDLQAGIQLQTVAESLQMSSATLKRKLKQHDTNFQSLLDMVRRRSAVDLMLNNKWNQEEVAKHLGIHDAANFRRAFRKWTGCSPKEYSRLTQPENADGIHSG